MSTKRLYSTRVPAFFSLRAMRETGWLRRTRKPRVPKVEGVALSALVCCNSFSVAVSRPSIVYLSCPRAVKFKGTVVRSFSTARLVGRRRLCTNVSKINQFEANIEAPQYEAIFRASSLHFTRTLGGTFSFLARSRFARPLHAAVYYTEQR